MSKPGDETFIRCEADGGMLPVPTNLDQNEYLVTWLNEANDAGRSTSFNAWLGISDRVRKTLIFLLETDQLLSI